MEANHRTRVLGIDFSGAINTGAKIYLTIGRIEEDTLNIKDSFQARFLPKSGETPHTLIDGTATLHLTISPNLIMQSFNSSLIFL